MTFFLWRCLKMDTTYDITCWECTPSYQWIIPDNRDSWLGQPSPYMDATHNSCYLKLLDTRIKLKLERLYGFTVITESCSLLTTFCHSSETKSLKLNFKWNFSKKTWVSCENEERKNQCHHFQLVNFQGGSNQSLAKRCNMKLFPIYCADSFSWWKPQL